MEQITLLSAEFSKVIREWLTEEELQKAIELNNSEKYKNCCATHDFCDPNEAMLQAFEKVQGRELNFQSEEDSILVDQAWTKAKENKFYL